jgi:serine protease Do
LVRLHPEVASVADQFVRVRLVKIAGADLRLFEFDYDLTWHVFFLNANETMYGRYGGRDASSAEGRFSLKGLRYAMTRALEAHRNPPPPKPLVGSPTRAEQFRAAASYKGCIHCHNINEFRREDLKAIGRWDRRDVWVYPLPENVGVTLDIDVGDLVREVRPHSPADRAGLKQGDTLRQLNGYAIASFADASYALHKAPAKGTIPVMWLHRGTERTGVLNVADGWRKTNVTWRPSMLDLLPSAPFSGDDLSEDEKRRFGLASGRAAFRQGNKVHPSLAAAGLKPGDVVIGFNGAGVDGDMSDLLGHLRRNYLVGEVVTVDVVRNGERVNLSLTLR